MRSVIVTAEKENPELGGSGYSAIDGRVTSPTIAHYDLPASDILPLSCDEGAVDYKTQRYFRIPDSLLDDPRFFDAPLAYQAVLLRCIKLAAFNPVEHNDNGMIIKLEPCQLCYSIRKLAELCGQHVERWDVERALTYFSKFQIVRHEVRHKKCVITFIRSDICDCIKSPSATRSATKVRQECDIKEEEHTDKNKKDKTPQPPIASAIGGVPGFDLSEIKVGGLAKQMELAGPADAQHNIKNYQPMRGRKPRQSNPKVEPLPIVEWAFQQYKSVCKIAKEPDWFVWNTHYGALLGQGHCEEDIKAVVTWITSTWNDTYCPQSALKHPNRIFDNFEEYFNRSKKRKSNPNTVDRRHLNPDGTPVENEFLKVW